MAFGELTLCNCLRIIRATRDHSDFVSGQGAYRINKVARDRSEPIARCRFASSQWVIGVDGKDFLHKFGLCMQITSERTEQQYVFLQQCSDFAAQADLLLKSK